MRPAHPASARMLYNMSGGKHKTAKKRFKTEEAALRAVLHHWQPLPSAPEDEYDCLVHHLLNVLHADSKIDATKVAACISDEMTAHFGLPVSAQEADVISRQICEAWKKVAHHV